MTALSYSRLKPEPTGSLFAAPFPEHLEPNSSEANLNLFGSSSTKPEIMNDPIITREEPLTFSLSEIASWKNGLLLPDANGPRATIPALQRGLVWEPHKNELLWDSILRGFPIGALVLTPWSERLKKKKEGDSKADYHLLDGQQRCNAIALGFEDPFEPEAQSEEVKTILWLDLEPESRGGSTRDFWIRATTTAHPWGYSRNDTTSPLGAAQIRYFLESLGIDPKGKRPSPLDLWPAPVSAKTPVPLGWLVKHHLTENDQDEFWEAIAKGSKRLEATHPWAINVRKLCESDVSRNEKTKIWQALTKARQALVVGLNAPLDLMDASEREKAEGEREDVSNIEQLFQRLNTLGTKLDGEELAYSMIKAYWPELEEKINEASNRRMPPARMVSLAVRAALVKDDDAHFPPYPTVSSIRSIAKTGHGKEIVENYIKHGLCDACNRVNDWLAYRETPDKEGGLLPVLISSIAINSREVYLLLLHFANRRMRAGAQDCDDWRNAMRALATTLHWFAIDRTKAVNLVLEACISEVTVKAVARGLATAIETACVHPLPLPGDDKESSAQCDGPRDHTGMTLSEFITIPSDADLSLWNWDKLIWKPDDEAGNLIRQRRWQGILSIRGNREMLIHAQRTFMAERFEDYDPQRKDLWLDHDRPWDFDHILAHKFFYDRRQGNRGPFIKLIGQWGHTIANLRAWPAADNRSDQWVTTSDKIGDSSKTMKDSFMIREEVQLFDWRDDLFDDRNAALHMVNAWRARLLRIYREWYDSVRVDLILPLARQSLDISPIAGVTAKEE